MLQDIYPQKFYPEYLPRHPHAHDYVLIFYEDQVVLEKGLQGWQLPQLSSVIKFIPELHEQLVYLFSVDNHGFFLYLNDFKISNDHFELQPIRSLRLFEPRWQAFAGITAKHLHFWYQTHRFCGRCAGQFKHDQERRSLTCAQCSLVAFPRIAPVVIVGIIDGDQLLVTRYARGPYKQYALVGGFVEIGETLEDAVQREVLEEVGLKVTNIRYYKSQPWALSGTLLAGFYADLRGSREIVLDTYELAEGLWVQRQEITAKNPDFDLNTLSLTSAMITAFQNQTFPR